MLPYLATLFVVAGLVGRVRAPAADGKPRQGRRVGEDSAAHDHDAGPAVDWPALRDAAREAMGRAYAPYSRFPVGAAALVDDGRIVSGCNVENASYGLTLCAECGLVSALHATGGGRLVAFACVDAAGAALMPCGRCRQLLYEFGGPGPAGGHRRGREADDLGRLLPRAFGPENLR